MTEIDQLYLVLVPVLHTCASAAAPRALERAYRRHGVHVLHTWASGHRRMGCKGTRHTYKPRVRDRRKKKKKKKEKEKGKKTGDGRRHITGSGTGTGTRPRWREGAIFEVLA